MNERELIDVLRSTASEVDWPEAPHVANRVGAQIRAPRRRLRWLAPAAALAVIIALVPPAREAVGNVLNAAGVTIAFGDSAGEQIADLDLGEAVGLADIQTDFEVRVPASLPPPDHVFSDGPAVHMVWVDAGEVDVLVSQRSGETGYATKTLGSDTTIEPVDVGGVPGIWIEGADHAFTLVDPSGIPRPETTRLAENVLLWSIDGVDYRLELAAGLSGAPGYRNVDEGRAMRRLIALCLMLLALPGDRQRPGVGGHRDE